MKRIFLAITAACLILIVACNNKQVSTTKVNETTGKAITFYGEAFDAADKTLSVEKLYKKMKKTAALNTTIKGEVENVCLKKGCWMTIKNPTGEPMRVTFKDYAFFMPMDCHNKIVTFKGKAYQDTTSVKMLRHYAEDENLPQEAINKITEPKVEIAFEATGAYFN